MLHQRSCGSKGLPKASLLCKKTSKKIAETLVSATFIFSVVQEQPEVAPQSRQSSQLPFRFILLLPHPEHVVPV